MDEKELKKMLSILKSAPVPKGYWENYWPKLSARIESASHRIGEPARETGWPWQMRWFVPTFALLSAGVAGYFIGIGQQTSPIHRFTGSPIRLTSDDAPQAQKVFKEMLELFPNRVNWISYVDGKVDFSISSVAYPDSKQLIPLVITLPRAKEAFETRLLIRPGQLAAVKGMWAKNVPIAIQTEIMPDGKSARVSCHVNGTAGLDTEVAISKEGQQPLGSFRWGESLIQVQMNRPSAKRKGEAAHAKRPA